MKNGSTTILKTNKLLKQNTKISKQKGKNGNRFPFAPDQKTETRIWYNDDPVQ